MRVSAAKCLSVLLAILTVPTISVAAPKDINPQLAVYARARVAEFSRIPAERKEELRKLAAAHRPRLRRSRTSNCCSSAYRFTPQPYRANVGTDSSNVLWRWSYRDFLGRNRGIGF